MSNPTNQAPSESTQSKLNQGFAWDPNLAANAFAEVPFIDVSTFKISGWMVTGYKFADGSDGLAFYNGKAALHFDNNNNIILSAGPPSQSGCGGKLIENVQQKMEKAKSITIEVTGRDDGGKTGKSENEKGEVEDDEMPSYSLKVYGPCNIEAIGGDVAIKGDNITLNAASTLNLKSNKDINIQAGETGGKISVNGGSFDLNTAFFKKNLSGGEFSEGTGEFSVDQKKPGASVDINTPGSVKYTVNGDYTVGVTGDYKLGVSGNFSTSVTKDYALEVRGKYGEVIDGKMKTEVKGVEGKPPSSQQENYILDVAVNQKKEMASYKVNTGGKVEFSALQDGYKFEVGKQLASLELANKKFEVTTGAKLGAIVMDEKQGVIEHGKTSKITVDPTKVKVEAAAASSITVSASDTTIISPLIYLN